MWEMKPKHCFFSVVFSDTWSNYPSNIPGRINWTYNSGIWKSTYPFCSFRCISSYWLIAYWFLLVLYLKWCILLINKLLDLAILSWVAMEIFDLWRKSSASTYLRHIYSYLVLVIKTHSFYFFLSLFTTPLFETTLGTVIRFSVFLLSRDYV